MTKNNNKIFNDLFVLELARNHWGSVERGKEIIKQYAKVIKNHNVHAAIKLQAFDTDSFIHKDFLPKEEDVADGENTQAPGSHTRYIKKTLATKLTDEEFTELVDEIKSYGLVSMVTPYDERSVDLIGKLNVDMVKLASSDTGCRTLVEKALGLGIPISISTGAVTLENVDRVVRLAEEKDIPILVNHCVSNYPSEDGDLHINHIEFWKKRYPNVAIGFSSHDYTDITNSHMLAVAKGAVSFERHVDIEKDDYSVSKYCIIPETADRWFTAHKKANEMLGDKVESVRTMTDFEYNYLKTVNRGVYAKRDIPKGYKFSHKNLNEVFYLAIPLQDGQISASELNEELDVMKKIDKDSAILHTSVRKNR